TPASSGNAYVVILHLSPDYESRLAEVLQTATKVPVRQVTGRTEMKPDHVYVVPPKSNLEMADAHLSVSPMSASDQRLATIDFFFRTLAEAYGPKAVGVVLSGTGTDGASGVKRVKESGGLAIVQDPNEAEYEDMPRNAIATGLVDYILPAGTIPSVIEGY